MSNLSFLSKTLLAIAFLFFYNITITKSQTLYEDAMKIADAIENQPQLIFHIKSNNNISIQYQANESKEEVTVVRWINAIKGLSNSKTRKIKLKKQGIYNIKITKKNAPNEGLISYGNDTLFFTGNDTISFKIINEIDRITLFDASNKMHLTANFILKKELIEIYSLLEKHAPSFNNTNSESTDFELVQRFNFVDKNRYLEPWLRNQKLSSLSLNASKEAIQNIQKNNLKNPPIDFSPYELLHGDQRKRKFETLKELQLSYQEQPPESSDKLKQISSRIEVRETNLSNLNSATLAAGLSDFVVERAQEEFNVAFMERMRERLLDPKYAEFRAFFPKSHSFFKKNIDIVNYKNLLPLARESFIHDIENLHHNIHNLFELPKYEKLKNAPSIYNLVLFYEMANLTYQDIPLDTIMPIAFNMLENRQKEFDQKINFALAKNLLTKKTTLQNLKEEIKNGNKKISNLAEEIGTEVFSLENKINDLIDKYEEDDNPAVQDLGKSLIQFQKKYIAKTNPLNERLFSFQGSFTLDEINANLDGTPNYTSFLDEPKLENYAALFDKTPDSLTLIAAGIDKSKSFYDTLNAEAILPFLIDYRIQLLETERYLSNLDSIYNFQKNNEIPTRIENYTTAINQLQKDLKTEITALKKAAIPLHDINAIKFLAKTIPTKKEIKKAKLLQKFAPIGTDLMASFRYYLTATSPLEKIREEENRKEKLQNYLIDKLQEIENNNNYKSPLLEKLTQQAPTANESKYEQKLTELNALQKQANLLFKKIKDYEKEQSPILFKARTNARQLGHLMEITTELLYAFRLNPENKNGDKYITKDMYKQLMSNPLRRDIFLGLLYEKLNNTDRFGEISSTGVANISTALMENIQVISAQRDTIASKNLWKKNVQFKDYYPIIKSGVNIINSFIETPLYHNISLAASQDSLVFKYIPPVSKNTLSLFENIYDKKYGLAIYDALSIFEIFAFEQEFSKGKIGTIQYENAKNKNIQVKNVILKYGTFMANVASATTATDVKNALKAAALPPGSSRIKRQHNSNISVNAYLMFSGGADILTNKSISENTKTRTGGTVGLSVPIGISFSKKFKRSTKKTSAPKVASYTLFFSVLDLGAVTTFRIDRKNNTDNSVNYNTDLLPDLKFSNLIAPGAFLYLNTAKAPFTFGIGAQYGPQLRKITVDGHPNISSTGSWRFVIHFGIDVPIFNLSTKNN